MKRDTTTPACAGLLKRLRESVGARLPKLLGTTVVCAGLLAPASGCAFLANLLQPGETTVRLVNDGDFPVDVVLYFDDEQNTLRAALTEFGTRMEFTIAPGEAASFSRDCEELQAIVIDDADLMIVGQVGPETDTDVYRDGDDFGCGDTLVFTFDHSAIVVDFGVSFAVEEGAAGA